MIQNTTITARRIVTGVLMLTLVFSAAYAPFSIQKPPKAKAQFVDHLNLIQNTIQAVASVDQVAVTKVLNGLAWMVAKRTIDSITRSTVNWINSGFNGSPAFVTDLQKNLSNLADSVADDYFNRLNKTVIDTTGFNIKTPFQDQINQKLRAEYYKQTGNLLGVSAYNLNGYSSNPQAFNNGTFSDGGFDAFFSQSQNPANNPFGAYKLASDQLWASIDVAEQQRKAEVQNGQGFLSDRGPCPAANTAPGSAVSLSKSQSELCKNRPIRTPGSVIVAMMPKTLQAGLDSLQAADSINEIVGALMGQLVNKVLGSGGLLGASQPSSGGGSSYIDQATSESQYSAQTTNLANGVIQNLESDRTSLNNFQKQWGIIIDAATRAQTSCGTRPEVTTILNQGNQELAKASTALSALNKQEDAINATIKSTAANKTQIISEATISYQTYLSNPIISPTEFGEASLQSNDSGSNTPPSYYTQMNNLAASCTVR